VPFNVATMLGFVVDLTPVVVILKLTDDAPAGTVTVEGTVAAALSDVTDIAMPPVGAAPLILTVPVGDTPPIIGFGLMAMLVKMGRRTVKGAEAEVPP